MDNLFFQLRHVLFQRFQPLPGALQNRLLSVEFFTGYQIQLGDGGIHGVAYVLLHFIANGAGAGAQIVVELAAELFKKLAGLHGCIQNCWYLKKYSSAIVTLHCRRYGDA